jgi:hypothetical protein
MSDRNEPTGGAMPEKKKRQEKRRPSGPGPCPHCSSSDVVRIVWGFPTLNAFRDAEAGRVALGGCCVTDQDPEWHCMECGKDFGRSAPQARD